MAQRISRQQADNLAEIVTRQMGLGDALCKSCQRRGVDASDTHYDGCRVMVQGAYGGFGVRMVHADTGESDLSSGYVPLREVYTFLRGMRSALLEIS